MAAAPGVSTAEVLGALATGGSISAATPSCATTTGPHSSFVAVHSALVPRDSAMAS
jgi:hypothetical protein